MPTHATARRPAWAQPVSVEYIIRKRRNTDLSPELAARVQRTDRLYGECLERGQHQPSGRFTGRSIPGGAVEMEICAHCEVPWISGNVNPRT